MTTTTNYEPQPPAALEGSTTAPSRLDIVSWVAPVSATDNPGGTWVVALEKKEVVNDC